MAYEVFAKINKTDSPDVAFKALQCNRMLTRNLLQKVDSPTEAMSISLFCMDKYGVDMDIKVVDWFVMYY